MNFQFRVNCFCSKENVAYILSSSDIITEWHNSSRTFFGLSHTSLVSSTLISVLLIQRKMNLRYFLIERSLYIFITTHASIFSSRYPIRRWMWWKLHEILGDKMCDKTLFSLPKALSSDSLVSNVLILHKWFKYTTQSIITFNTFLTVSRTFCNR